MTEFIIVETDDGLTVAGQSAGDDAAATAAKIGGTVIDPGPYKTYEEAYDVMVEMPVDAEEEMD